MSKEGKVNDALRFLAGVKAETGTETGVEVASEFEVESKGEGVGVDVVRARVCPFTRFCASSWVHFSCGCFQGGASAQVLAPPCPPTLSTPPIYLSISGSGAV